MKKSILALMLIAGVFGMNAQGNHPAKKNESSDVTIILGNPADSLKVYQAFVENAPKVFNIASAPRFAIIGKNDKFYLGIGGTLKGVVGFDFPNPISSDVFFSPAYIPMGQAKGNGGQFWINAQQSNIYFNAVALPNTANQIGFYFNFDLCNSGYAPYVQYAYLTYRGFLVGYNTSLYFDGAACPPTIDKSGPNSLTYDLNPVFDYIHAFNSKVSVAIGAEIGSKTFTTNEYTASVNQRLPDVPLYFQYNFKGNPNNYVRISAMARWLQYRDMVKNDNQTKTGWGVKASGTMGNNWIVAYYQIGYGKGVTGYFQDLTGADMDLSPVPNVEGKLDLVEAWGGYAGLQFNWSQKCYSAISYSHIRTYMKNYGSQYDASTAWSSQYKYGQYLVANVFYNITNNLTWGLEWDWGRRVDYSGQSAHDNRLQSMLQFNF